MKGRIPGPIALSMRVIEVVKICRDCEWDVQKHELIQLLTGFEQEAKEIIADVTRHIEVTND